MKTWKIEINAKDEAQAARILRAMTEAFETAAKFSLPLDHISMDAQDCNEFSTCEHIKK